MSAVQHQPDPNKTNSDDQTVVEFPATKETENARRIMAEATRLAGLSPGMEDLD
jgi:hypothetical protein